MDNKLWDTVSWRVLSLLPGDVIVIRSDFIAEEDIADLRTAILTHTGKRVGVVVLPSEAEFTTLDADDRKALADLLLKSLLPVDPLIEIPK